MLSSPCLLGCREDVNLVPWIESEPEGLDCLEVLASVGSGPRFARLASHYSLVLMDFSLSIGTQETVSEESFGWLLSLVNEARPLWITTPLGFTRTHEVELRFPTPILTSPKNVSLVAAKVSQFQDLSGYPLLLENVPTHLDLRQPLPETEFLERICREAGCHLSLSIPALVANSRAQDLDPIQWIESLDPDLIVQIKIGNCGSDWIGIESGLKSYESEIWQLAEHLIGQTSPRTAVLNQERGYSPVAAAKDLQRLRRIVQRTKSSST